VAGDLWLFVVIIKPVPVCVQTLRDPGSLDPFGACLRFVEQELLAA
jgi:hypothetical protein